MKLPLQSSLLVLALAILPGTSALAQLKAPSRAPAAASAPAAPSASEPAAQADHDEEEQAGVLAATAWLSLLDRKDWGTAWDTSAAPFRSSVPLATWMDRIPKLRESLGAVTERAPGQPAYRNKLPGRPDGDYVTVTFDTHFANKPDAQEIVTTVRERDGKWRVTGYGTR